MQKETNGPFLDLLQFYLSNIFIMQEEEEADEEEADNDDKENQISGTARRTVIGLSSSFTNTHLMLGAFMKNLFALASPSNLIVPSADKPQIPNPFKK